jgi:hypothetical protein
MFSKFNFTALLLVIFLLAACAPAPEYGPVTEVPDTEAVSESSTNTPTPEVTATEVFTPTPTERPDASGQAVVWTNIVFTFSDPYEMRDDVCAISGERGCWEASLIADQIKLSGYEPPAEISQPEGIETRLLIEGFMHDGVEYQAWEVLFMHAGREVNRYPVFVWEDGEWKFYSAPDGWTLEILQACGQFIDITLTGEYVYERVIEQVLACQTATPQPTPWVAVTPVFTPQP